MTAEHTLEELADECGIERDFLDYKKDPVHIPIEARTRILELLGHDTNAAAVREALDKIRNQCWQQAIPPLLVLDEGEAIALTLHLPASLFAAELSLRIRCEKGSLIHIRVDAADAEVSASQMLGTEKMERRECRLAKDLPCGYYEAELYAHGERPLGSMKLIVTPRHAYLPDAIEQGRRLFGISVQLYTLRSSRNWGIGDFSDLKQLIEISHSQGVDVIGVSPLHALFPANPLHFSPYSPSNRAFLNVMFIDPEDIPEFHQCSEVAEEVNDSAFQKKLQALRDRHFVDYAAVAACKLPVLEALYRQFRDQELERESSRAVAFQRFVAAQGEALRLHALYDCLHEHFLRRDLRCWGWPVWPEEFRDPASPAVANFARENADRVQYFAYLQWCAHVQLCAAQATASSMGMAVGIYLDFAVGVDSNGSEVWSNQTAFALEASAGAPPDELARSGQDWGFPPLCPRHLQRTGYDLFIRNLRANMSRCGAVRYDHAVSLLRLWWIPREGNATEGAYVRYSLETMLGLVALESKRNGCLVIGEDLGTVPSELTRQMESRNIFSYKVLYFEKTNGAMTPPQSYAFAAAATITTHDLPTLASWWDGSDMDLRAGLGLLGSEEAIAALRLAREEDRYRLLHSLTDAGFWTGSTNPSEVPTMTIELNVAVHRFLAQSRAGLMITQLEDLMQMQAPVNVPGTFEDHANWQRKLRLPLEGLFEREDTTEICAAVREGRHP